jgi:hypothetical protein
MDWGDGQGLEFHGGSTQNIKFSSHNLSSIGTISSGTITSSGNIITQADSGSAGIKIKRTNSATSGARGFIGFMDSDNNFVASIDSRATGVNNSGDMRFTTSTGEAESGVYNLTPVLTLGTDNNATFAGQIRFTSSSSIRSDNPISFNTIAGAAQSGLFKSVAAQTSYANSASDGMFNALNGYAVGTGTGTTVIDASRNLTNIGTISSGAILSTQANNNDIEVRSVGDYFPSLTIARTSGTTKANYEWNFQIGSDGYLNFKDITNGYYPLIFRNNGDVYLGNNTSAASPVLLLDQSAASATFAGNITVSGTVDGRDVAADGTKLDGIESGATADQTQADINALGITQVGTISSGTWQGTAIASAYLDSDTAHLSGTQTFTGVKTFSGSTTLSGGVSLSNSNITNVNALSFADPGPNEGLSWSGGNIKLYESPDDLTTNTAGNLQVVYGSTRRLTVTNTGVDVNGALTATTKSFDIEHPSKEGMRLRYGSLEGPENGVYVRGKSKEKVILLPDYWVDLIHEDTITVQLTAIGSGQDLYVEDIKDNKVFVNGDNYFYYIQAERKDVDRFEVEYEG